MLIGVISDTHGHVVQTRQAVAALRDYDLELVVHCGDIGSWEIPPLLAHWPAHYVLGNVDRDELALRRAIAEAGAVCHGRLASLQLAGCAVAVVHGDDAKLRAETIAGGMYDLVCCGHTHRAEQRQHGPTLVLNPGAVFRASPHSVAVVQLPQRIVTLVEF